MIDKRPRIIVVMRKSQKCPVCGCRRFRKVNWDGTDAPVKVKMLKNARKAPVTLINWESNIAINTVGKNERSKIHHYKVVVD